MRSEAAEVVGHESDIGMVLDLLDSATARAHILVGDPGIGKTTVLRLGIAEARRRSFEVLSARHGGGRDRHDVRRRRRSSTPWWQP